jgi:putative oxidoreductase
MQLLYRWLFDWPERTARHLTWLPPLFARFTLGWVFMWTGWAKLNNLPSMIENFTGWGIPFPTILTPFVSGLEFVGGAFLLAGFLTRITSGALGVTMIVAIIVAYWEEIDSLETLLGLSETAYIALFFYLAIAGSGKLSVDEWLRRRVGSVSTQDPSAVPNAASSQSA